MDYPFYRIRPNYPYPPTTREAPALYASDPVPAKKVVTIPVHYVGSERNISRPYSALKIQKLFRGYRVRKSLKRIVDIRKEVDEIEKRLSTEEYAEIVRKDCKERLKVNEMLMSLLFKLDSVNGVDAGVRDFRKTTIKKAIALQEKVDSFGSDPYVDRMTNSETGEAQGENLNSSENTTAIDQTGETNSGDQITRGEANDDDPMGDETDSLDRAGQVLPDNAINQIGEEVVHGKFNSAENVPDTMDEAVSPGEVVGENMEEGKVAEDDISSECGESVEASQMESQAEASSNPCHMIERGENISDEEVEDNDGDCCDGLEKQEDGVGKEMVEGNECNAGEEGKEDSKKSREMLQRLVEDNGRMMGLMAELFERNEMQTRMLSSLSLRVEQLERALICEKLRRKKKRNAAGSLVDCLESTQDAKKCGKK